MLAVKESYETLYTVMYSNFCCSDSFFNRCPGVVSCGFCYIRAKSIIRQSEREGGREGGGVKQRRAGRGL